jgi:DNA-binding transcriptional ArsR family regulator
MSRISASADPFQAVADPTRRAILDRLRYGSAPVNELVSGFNVSRPAISQHLRVLRDAHLVGCQREGRLQIYTIRPEQLRTVAHWLAAYRVFWEGKLANLKNHLEKKK